MKINYDLRDMKPIVSETGELIYELVRGKYSSTALVVIPAGKKSPKHVHDGGREETYTIDTGIGRLVINDKEIWVRPGNTILIMPGDVHQIFSRPDAELIFHVFSAPPYSQRHTHIVD